MEEHVQQCRRGHNVPGSQRFCGECGEEVERSEAGDSTPIATPPRNRHRILTTAAIIVILVIGGVAIRWAVEDEDRQQERRPAEAAQEVPPPPSEEARPGELGYTEAVVSMLCGVPQEQVSFDYTRSTADDMGTLLYYELGDTDYATVTQVEGLPKPWFVTCSGVMVGQFSHQEYQSLLNR